MGGFFSSPSEFERQANANAYQARPNYFSKNLPGNNAGAGAVAGNSVPGNAGAPATRRNRRTNYMTGGKSRRNRRTNRKNATARRRR